MAQGQGYARPARLYHWIIALLVLLMIPAGLIMIREGLPRPVQDTLFIFHKNAGLLVFLLMLARLIWRLRHPVPPLPPEIAPWQRRAAELTHLALYVLLIAMPVSGYLRVRLDRFPIESLDAMSVPPLVPKNEALAGFFQSVHQICALLLIALLALHVAAALHHALIRRDGVWARIWPPFQAGCTSGPGD